MRALITSGSVDAVLIATPHFSHVPIGVAALGAGLHVPCEKPLAVHEVDAGRLLAAHVRFPGVTLASRLMVYDTVTPANGQRSLLV